MPHASHLSLQKMKTIKIFLASSAELKSDREQFEIFINRKNKQWVNRGVFLHLLIWEDGLDAMSKTRLQDEYNKAIRECDLFVVLFLPRSGNIPRKSLRLLLVSFTRRTNRLSSPISKHLKST